MKIQQVSSTSFLNQTTIRQSAITARTRHAKSAAVQVHRRSPDTRDKQDYRQHTEQKDDSPVNRHDMRLYKFYNDA